ncbi:unnamed protein product [Boreogadus saida]
MNGIRTERLAEKLLRLGYPEHCSWFPAPRARSAHRQNARLRSAPGCGRLRAAVGSGLRSAPGGVPSGADRALQAQVSDVHTPVVHLWFT